MTRLEELTPGAVVRGVVPGEAVTVVASRWAGTRSLILTFRTASGRVDEQVVYRTQEGDLGLDGRGMTWSFDGDPALFRLVAEARRIRLAYLFDPRLAVHLSLIEPLPHQIIAVYGEMLPRQPLRFCLADDPGAGKTIMAGLYIKELMLRGDLRRCLIVAPGGLVGQWQDELHDKFGLDFSILTRELIEAARTGDPFSERNLLIGRLDHLSRNDDLVERLAATEWDLVVVDEAHRMAAHYFGNEVKETKRYRLGKVLGETARHFLLMTATPHAGKEEDFQLFMALLDSDRFEGKVRDGVHTADVSDLMRRMVKENVLRFDGRPLFPERRAYTVPYELSDLEMALYAEVTDYVAEEMGRAERLSAEGEGRRGNRVGFALTVLQRRLASSPEAIFQSLSRRRKRLEDRARDARAQQRAHAILAETEPLRIQLDDPDEDFDDDIEDLEGAEVEELEEQLLDQATSARTLAELQHEIATLGRLEVLADRVRQSQVDKKWTELLGLLADAPEMMEAGGTRRKLIVFTEHRDTLNYLVGKLRTYLGKDEAVVASSDEKVLAEARREIHRSYPSGPPAIVDPFCGGGSIPIEAQRLGLETHASDLNPVAVLITKALIELPPKFLDRPPVHPDSGATFKGIESWRGARGLAEDVRHYGSWMRDEAERRLRHLYPKAGLPDGTEATVIAWLWARTVTCPNPACGATMPLVSSFWLRKKLGTEAWVRARPDRARKDVKFDIGNGKEGPVVVGTKQGRGTGFICLVCNSPVSQLYVHDEIDGRRSGVQLMTSVAQGARQRTYLTPTREQELAAQCERPAGAPDEPARGTFGGNAQGRRYGFRTFSDYFTNRQLTALCTFTGLVGEARERVIGDSDGNTDYANAVATYLASSISKLSDWSSSVCSWIAQIEGVRDTFARQAISMVWDFAEINPFSWGVGNFLNHIEWVASGLDQIVVPQSHNGLCRQSSAEDAITASCVLSTDPPYYDNIGYADLSDFFYVWLRRSLRNVYPELFATVLTPKTEELIASPYRFAGDKQKAEEHFEAGFKRIFATAARHAESATPMTIFYAFKQSESDEYDEGGTRGVASTGWEKRLQGLLESGLMVTGTWPMRTERSGRSVEIGTNALASSIVLVCRPRPDGAGVTDRRGFVQALKGKLGHGLRDLQSGGIAPVDLAQAAIGPGMAVFSSYAKVVEADGRPMRVRTALALINQVLDEVTAEQEGEFDEDTRWAIAWYGEQGMEDGSYGRADDLSRAKNVSVDGLVRAGLVKAGGGKVRLLTRDELDPTWDPTTDPRLTVWEVTQHLIRRLLNDGEASAAVLLSKVGGFGDAARDLAYRLFQVAEAKKWPKEAAPYNALAASWPEISRMAAAEPAAQGSLPGLRVDGDK